MKILRRLPLIAALSVVPCFAQTGTVTFYSQRISLKSEGAVFLPKSEQPFGGLQGGWVLDGSQRLARVRVGRFVTFRFDAGQHTFTDAGPTGTSKTPVVLEVKDGGEYCVRLYAKVVNAGVYAKWENQMEEVPCRLARREGAHLKPVEVKRVDPAVLGELDPGSSFPVAAERKGDSLAPQRAASPATPARE